jgi:hypothetical protein
VASKAGPELRPEEGARQERTLWSRPILLVGVTLCACVVSQGIPFSTLEKVGGPAHGDKTWLRCPAQPRPPPARLPR